MTANELKQKFKENKASYSSATATRIHRALSWLNKAESTADDLDSQFIYLWISFNAAYTQEPDVNLAESEAFNLFIQHILSLDKDSLIQQTLFKEFSQAIRVLLDNQYVYQPFWNYYSKKVDNDWKEKFNKSKIVAQTALLNKETHKVMSIVFSRLYTLRNQLLHGGATYGSSANRGQLKDACKILSTLMTHIILIMIENPESFTGQEIYPFIQIS